MTAAAFVPMFIFRLTLFFAISVRALCPGYAGSPDILPDHFTPTALNVFPPDDCIDSVHISVKPVQCHGLRNGVIRVDSVFGGSAPFYFSLDGVSYSTRPEFDHLWPGSYEVWIRDAAGCERRQEVIVHEPEDVTVHLSAVDTLIPSGAYVDITATVSPPETKISSISWRPPDLFSVQDTLFQRIHLRETKTIAVEIRTLQQCVASDQITILVERNSVYAPNIIQPGSNQNAYFTLFADEALEIVLELQIYSRTGSLVFERRRFEPNDPLKGWNGKWKDRNAQPGVYAWTALLQFADGAQERRTGTVTVVR